VLPRNVLPRNALPRHALPRDVLPRDVLPRKLEPLGAKLASSWMKAAARARVGHPRYLLWGIKVPH
jgi:hypothetical protein